MITRLRLPPPLALQLAFASKAGLPVSATFLMFHLVSTCPRPLASPISLVPYLSQIALTDQASSKLLTPRPSLISQRHLVSSIFLMKFDEDLPTPALPPSLTS